MHDDLKPTSLDAVFLQEAEEGLTAMEQALIELDAHPDAAGPLNEVFRIAHTIKGGAAMVGFAAVAEFAHSVEDALTMMRDGLVAVTPDLASLEQHFRRTDEPLGIVDQADRGQRRGLSAAESPDFQGF